jgi:hypothetical protein
LTILVTLLPLSLPGTAVHPVISSAFVPNGLSDSRKL